MEINKTSDASVYTEIYVILNKLGFFDKLPSELKKYIEESKSTSYKYDFDMNIPLIYQIDNKKTKAYLSYLFLKYINDSDALKEMLLKRYKEKLCQAESRKNNSKNIFKNKKKT